MKIRELVLLIAILMAVNLWIVWRLFSLEHSAYLAINDPSFMAMARGIATHPRDLLWWPYWDGGIPFQNTYLPLLAAMVALVNAISGWSIAHSFHAVSAALFCLGPVLWFVMAGVISGRRWASFFGALGYSVLSPTAFLLPEVRLDMHSVWNLRRLHILLFYGEAPLMAALAWFPLAVLFLYLAITRKQFRFAAAAGVSVAAVCLTNAFGAVLLGLAITCLLSTIETRRFWTNLAMVVAIAALTYLWISPLAPPSVLQAIRLNSPTVDGDYRFNIRSFWGACGLGCGFVILWRTSRAWISGPLRVLCLFALATGGIALLGAVLRVYVLPQPHRYLVSLDPALCLIGAFAGEAILERFPVTIRRGLLVFAVIAAAFQTAHAARYGWDLVQPVDITQTANYKIARWLEAHLPGQRVMVSSSHAYLINVFSDIPQLRGGHDPMVPNHVIRIAAYAIYGGHVPGVADGEFAVLWLKALGAHAITVPGPASSEVFKPFTDPWKFEGILPVLWRENGDTIYGVPSRSPSMAHVVPASALVARRNAESVDVSRLKNYVDALDDPANPVAEMRWENRHRARIRATVARGQVISVQVNYHPGWHATEDGRVRRVRPDALGLIVVEPAHAGDCEFVLDYDGGLELAVTRIFSSCVTLAILATAAAALRRRITGRRSER